MQPSWIGNCCVPGNYSGKLFRGEFFLWWRRACALAGSRIPARTKGQAMTQEQANMKVQRNGSVASRKGPAETFTGSVRIDSSFAAEAPGRAGGAIVTFEPGARTHWHTHPLGQTLIVTAGVGWTQCWGEKREEIRAGDVVWCPPNKKHWHGATP